MTTDLIGRLPLPLAQIYLRARNARSPAERHHNAYYLLEASARTSAALLIASYAAEDEPDPKADKALQALAQPSVGQWVGILRELAGRRGGGEEGEGSPLNAWRKLFSERAKGLTRCAALARAIAEQDELDLGFGEKLSPVDVFNLLPAYRNKHLGHGGLAGEMFFQRFGALLREAAEELLQKVDPLAGGELVFVEEKREIAPGESAAERIRLVGATPLRLDALEGLTDTLSPWETGRLYAVWPDRQPVPLHPLLYGTYSEERAEVSFYNKRAGSGSAEFLNYTTGLLTKISLAEEDFRFLDEASQDADKRPRRRPPQGAQAGPEADREAPRPAKVWRRSVAVLGFKNLVGRPESAWLSTALAEMLTTELAAAGRLRLVSGENVARMKIDLALADAESFSKETLSRIRANLGCDFVVLGAYLAMGEKAGGQVRLDLRVQDAAAGSTVTSIMETGGEVEFLEIVSRAGARLRETFGEEALTATQAQQVKAALPSGLDAVKLYAEGLAKLRAYDALSAKDLLEKAVSADPKNALARSALASAWSVLGYDERAKTEAKGALDLSGALAREDGLLVEGRFREYAREWDKAIEIYKSLHTFFPDNVDYGIKLVESQAWAGKGKDTAPVLSALRQLPAPAAEDPRIDLAEARVAQALSDPKACRDATARAAEKAAALGAGTFVARARFLEAFALGLLGEPDQALKAAEESRALFAKAGDLGGVAEAMNSAALIHWHRGELNEAEKLHQEALETFQAIGKRQGVAAALQNLGWLLFQQGKMSPAKEKTEEALAAWREIGSRRGEAEALSYLGTIYYETMNIPKAKECFQESISIYAETGNQRGSAYTLNNLGLVFLEEGEFEKAIELFVHGREVMENCGNRLGFGMSLGNLGLALFYHGDLKAAQKAETEAIDTLRQAGEKSHLAGTLNYLGNIYLHQGRLGAAKTSLDVALVLALEVAEESTISQIRLDLASVFLEEGLFVEAETTAAQAIEGFREAGLREEEAYASCALAKAFLAQGKVDEARQQVDEARQALVQMDHPHFRMAVTIAAAQTQSAVPDPAQAAAAFDVLEARVQESAGVIPLHLHFEARLALGEMALRSGRIDEGLSILQGLQQEASAKGFGLIAGKASSLVG